MAGTMNPVEIDISTVTICTKVPHLEQETDDENTKQTQTIAMLCEQYPPEACTNVYTDGFATNVIQVLPFTSLVAAQKQPMQQHEYTKATTKQRH